VNLPGPAAASAVLLASLRKHRLLAPAQLKEVSQSLLARFPDPKDLARQLLLRDWLTPYQANRELSAAAGEAASTIQGPAPTPVGGADMPEAPREAAVPVTIRPSGSGRRRCRPPPCS
jgi:hypothetical protein